MRQCGIVFCGFVSLLLMAPAVKAGPILYGGVGNSGSTPGAADGSLVILDQTNAAATLVGQPANVGITGLAFNSLGELWASAAANRTGAAPFLEQVNRLTGAQIGSVNLTTGGSPLVIGDLSFQPGTDVLFGISTGGFLYTINTTTGVATLVGDTGTGRTGGLAFAPNGTLYLAGAPSTLYTLSPLNAAVLTSIEVTDPNTLSSFFMDGLGIRPTDGALFAAQAAVNGVYTIDAATGFVTALGTVSTGKLSDLAFFDTPEPGSWTLLTAGLLALMGLSRRKA